MERDIQRCSDTTRIAIPPRCGFRCSKSNRQHQPLSLFFRVWRVWMKIKSRVSRSHPLTLFFLYYIIIIIIIIFKSLGHCCCSCCRFRGAYHLMLSSCLCFSHLFVSSHRSSSNSICHQPGVGIVFSMLTRYFSFYKHQVTTNMSSPALRKTKSCSRISYWIPTWWCRAGLLPWIT